ncbi:MAG: DUF4124 domain-containing protein [Betaproteobacteria bacterium]|nr:DUF4124 domain-containing protein [Betaproteobacteria bacterium]
MSLDDRLRSSLRTLAAAALALACASALAQSLQSKSRELGCTDAPRVVAGTNLYKCTTATGNAAFFNVPDAGERPAPKRAPAVAPAPAAAPSAAASFPRVDANTQKGRDEMRRKVLQDELAVEEKLLAEARGAYGNGAPPALADEQSQPQRYAERIARLRQSVQLHERNVEALRKELGLPR